jgi:endonuclease/exonuclease/phosphatase family metal-dependent hydrolase
MRRLSPLLCLSLLACQAGIEGEAPNFGGARASLLPGQARVITWNIETIGTRGSAEYQAELDVLRRLGADVVSLNEVDSIIDATSFAQFAADAGYPNTALSAGSGFGTDRSAILSRFPILSSRSITAAEVSGDPNARDITRLPLETVVDLPGTSRDLRLISVHLKSGDTNGDEFRRVVESIRVAQALSARDPQRDLYVVLGDINEELDSVPRTPVLFTSLPTGLPSTFRLGTDINAQMTGGGLENDPFAAWQATPKPAMNALAALRLDGQDGTRPASGRRLDYLFLSPALAAQSPKGEVFFSGLDGTTGLPKVGAPLAAGTNATASDHLPVIMDFFVPSEAGEEVMVSFKDSATVPGLGTVNNEDIVSFDAASGSWSFLFDGSDVGLGSTAIDALAVDSNGNFLMSFEGAVTLGGVSFDDSDVVRFSATSLGTTTAGSFSFFLDGSDLGLSTDDEDVDGLALLADGRVVLSTLGAYSAGGLVGDDVDLIALQATSLGATTAGTLSVFFDGSAAGLAAGSGDDIDALAFTSDGQVRFSTVGDTTVEGLAVRDEDVIGGLPGGALDPVVALSLVLAGIDVSEDIGALEVVK